MAIFHIMKYDVKCGTCLHKFDCIETTLSNAANHLKIFENLSYVCMNPLFPIAVFISMLWQHKVNMLFPKNNFPIE